MSGDALLEALLETANVEAFKLEREFGVAVHAEPRPQRTGDQLVALVLTDTRQAFEHFKPEEAALEARKYLVELRHDNQTKAATPMAATNGQKKTKITPTEAKPGIKYDAGKLDYSKVPWQQLKPFFEKFANPPTFNPTEVGTIEEVRWDLVPWDIVFEFACVLSFGAQEYKPNNWKSVEDQRNRYFAAMMRHVIDWFSVDECDPKTGYHHLAHALCNAAFLHWFDSEEGQQYLEVQAHLRHRPADHSPAESLGSEEKEV